MGPFHMRNRNFRRFGLQFKSPLLDASPSLSDRDACYLRGAASRGGICDDLGFGHLDHPDLTTLLLGWSAPNPHLLGQQGLKDQDGR